MKIKTLKAFVLCAALVLTGFGDTAHFSNKRGAGLYNEKRYEEALEEFRRAQADDPDNTSVDYNLGGAYYKLNKYTEALRAYDRARGTDDEEVKRRSAFNSGAAMYRAGEAAQNGNRTDEALKFFTGSAAQYKALLRQDRTDDDARHNLELALMKIDQMKQKQKQQEQRKRDQQDQKEGERQDRAESKKGDDAAEKGEQPRKAEQQQPRDEKKDASENKHAEAGKPEKISREQAQMIFNAIERDEQKLKKQMRAKTRREPAATGKDW